MTKTEAKWVLANDPKARAAAQRVLEARRRVSAKKAPSRIEAAARLVDAKVRRAEIRLAVAARAGGKCERCGAHAGEALHWDHFHGRAREESVESTWMLCSRCDHRKTTNDPTRSLWLCYFRDHCERMGYAAQVSKVDRLRALERAQHPEHA